MKWSQNIQINSHDTDANRLLRASSVLRYMQEAACLQIEEEHPSYMELYAQGKVFLLSQIRVQIDHPIYSHDWITAETWTCESKGARFNRCYRLCRDREVMAEASSVWALVDVRDGRLCRAGEIPLQYCRDEQLVLDLPTRIHLPADLPMALVGEHTVEYRDIDVNHHMNNTQYPDILCNAIPDMQNLRVTNMCLNYVSEASYGDTLKIYMVYTDGAYYFRTVRRDGKTNLEARICVEAL